MNRLLTAIHQSEGLHTVSRVLDGHDDAGSEHELLPGLGKVDDVQTIGAALPDVRDLCKTLKTIRRELETHTAPSRSPMTAARISFLVPRCTWAASILAQSSSVGRSGCGRKARDDADIRVKLHAGTWVGKSTARGGKKRLARGG
eukprot:2877400-Rhodomonas_salina.2